MRDCTVNVTPLFGEVLDKISVHCMNDYNTITICINMHKIMHFKENLSKLNYYFYTQYIQYWHWSL